MEIKPIADTLFCGYNFIISIIFFNSKFYIKQIIFFLLFLYEKQMKSLIHS